jgi:iron complex outermembrane receptor protein
MLLAQEKTNKEIVVTVTAARVTRETCDVPANVTVITSDDIRDSGSASLVDVLKNQCDVEMRDTSGPATADISMRGFGENSGGRVLVLLDGRKLNNPDMAPVDWLAVPVNNVDRIEVVRGGGSALYGNNAIGGVVNIITKTGSREPQFDVSEEAGSYGMNLSRLGFSDSTGSLGYSINGDRYVSTGYRDRSAFTSGGGGGSATYDINNSVSASLSVSAQSIDYQLPGSLTKQQMEDDPRQAINQDDSGEDTYYNANLALSAELGNGQHGNLNLSYTRKNVTSDLTSWSSFDYATVDTFGVTPQYSLESAIAGHADKVVAGVDYYDDILDVDRYSDKNHDEVTGTAKVERDTLAAYARNELTTIESVVLALDARAETARTAADVFESGAETVDASKTFNETAVDASLIKTFENKSKIYAKGGTIYRYPFVDEQVSYYGIGDMFDLNLKPERGWDAEVGTEINAAKGLVIGMSLFRLDMADEIAYDYVTQENVNLDHTVHQGVETYFNYSALEFVKLSGNYTFNDTRFTEGANDGKDVPLVPMHKASADVKLLLPLDLAFDTVATYTSDCFLGGDDSNVGPKLPSYTVVNMFLRCTPKVVRGLEVYAGVENVFNEQYASLGYMGVPEAGYYPSPGRTFRGGASYRF